MCELQYLVNITAARFSSHNFAPKTISQKQAEESGITHGKVQQAEE